MIWIGVRGLWKMGELESSLEQPEESGPARHTEAGLVSEEREAQAGDVGGDESFGGTTEPRPERWKIISILGFVIVGVVLITCPLLSLRFVSRQFTQALTARLIREAFPPISVAWATIPEGEFFMGSLETDVSADPDEKPQHPVYLDVFQIMPHEVTNWEYTQCILAEVCKSPNKDTFDKTEYGDFPVAGVDWQDANIFCDWIGGRLPTEAEWEKAARGGLEGKLYPWGDEELTCELANYWGGSTGCVSDFTPVGNYAPNGYGLFDMAGNVSEWVMDEYSWDYYSYSPYENPQGPQSFFRAHVVRNGAWTEKEWHQRSAYRGWELPDYRGIALGFRCARSP